MSVVSLDHFSSDQKISAWQKQIFNKASNISQSPLIKAGSNHGPKTQKRNLYSLNNQSSNNKNKNNIDNIETN